MADRQPIQDVPAVYFVEPTSQNMKRIASDLQKGLYENFYINFSSVVPRTLLEELASEAIQVGATQLVSQVYDQYLDFICLEPNLFTLNQQLSYHGIHDPNASESAIANIVTRVSSGLFSVCATLASVPLIRYSRGGAAEMIARKLEQRLVNHLGSRDNVFVSGSSVRPILVLADRNIDLVSMLSHTWTYAPLVHDILDMKLNRVNVQVGEILFWLTNDRRKKRV